MTAGNPRMKVDEFFEQALGGERNYRGVVFGPYYELSANPRYGELQTLLKDEKTQESLQTDPFDFSYTKWENLIALGLHMPHVKAERANFSGADLRGANFASAIMNHAKLYQADLRKANFSNAHLISANFIGAKLNEANLAEAELLLARMSGANLLDANLWKTDFERADLRGAINLQRALHLEDAHWNGTYANPDDVEFILSLLNPFNRKKTR